jgi:hypothetical protein
MKNEIKIPEKLDGINETAAAKGIEQRVPAVPGKKGALPEYPPNAKKRIIFSKLKFMAFIPFFLMNKYLLFQE